MPQVIREPDEVTPEWLSVVLRRQFSGWNRQITSVDIEVDKELQYSRVATLRIGYSGAKPYELPDRFFLKLSGTARDDLKRLDNGAEVDFYRTAARAMNGPPLVRCYDAQYSTETDLSHLLLEDLSSSHFQTAQREHPSLLSSELAIKCLARFHADFWDHPALGKSIGKIYDHSWLDLFIKELEVSVAKFIDFLGNELSTERKNAYERMVTAGRTIWGRLTDASNLTVTHGDMHWWNFLHPKDPGKHQTRIIDWQLWHIDLGPRDLAFLIALGGFADRKPELETHLIRCYYQTLIDNGVQNYSRSRFWDDYRWSAIRNLNIPVIFWTQGKHRSTWQNALERAFQSYNELKASELI